MTILFNTIRKWEGRGCDLGVSEFLEGESLLAGVGADVRTEKNGKSSSSSSALKSVALWLWLHKPFTEAQLPPSCQANPLGWRAPLIPLQENGTEDINQDYYTGLCSSQASYHKITPQHTNMHANPKL